MKLQSLNIWPTYVQEGHYHGSITVSGEHGKVELNLSPEQANRIVRVVAQELVTSAKEVAMNLTAECIEYRDQAVIQG